MSSYLITGASRGLGLAMATVLASRPLAEVSVVFAASRRSTPELEKLVQESSGRVVAVKIEVTDEESIRQAVAEVESVVKGRGLDVVINNAGITNYTPDGIETMNDLIPIFNVNVNSVHLVTKYFLPLLRKGQKKEIVNISSAMGSITRAPQYMFQPTPAYKISKAALNMLTVQYSLSLAEEGFIVFSVDPGWVRTDMGSSAADLSIEEGSNGLVNKITSATMADSGKFFNAKIPTWKGNGGPNTYSGEPMPF